MTQRVKTLESLLEKIERKSYENPLVEITDIAGARLVYLYESDLDKIRKLVSENFQVLEEVDKSAAQGVEKFGYGALHFVVKIGESSRGARYDDLRELKCEIQVRTVLQDAWSIISHHLIYKRESDVPNRLRRRINSLSGLLETADDQFDRLRHDRDRYRDELIASLNTEKLGLEQEINADSVAAFLKWALPDLELEVSANHIPIVLEDLPPEYKALADFASVLERTKVARKKMRVQYPEKLTAAGELANAIGLASPVYRSDGWDPESLFILEQFENLVEKQ